MFEAGDALAAADQMVVFRNGVTQALRRAGYHASFVGRPPFPNVISGWHCTSRCVDLATGDNAFRRDAGRRAAAPATRSTCSPPPARPGSRACSSTAGRWRCSAHRRSMPTGGSGRTDGAERVHLGPRQQRRDAARARPCRRCRHADREPDRRARRQSLPLHRGADPAGLDGLEARSGGSAGDRGAVWAAGSGSRRLPASLGEALERSPPTDAWSRPSCAGHDMVDQVKRAELARHDQAEDRTLEARGYFSRF